MHGLNRYTLCQKLCGVYDSPGACFHYEIRECKGACLGLERRKRTTRRAELVIGKLQYQHHNMFIIDRGRHVEEKAVVKIEYGRYVGFGFMVLSVLTAWKACTIASKPIMITTMYNGLFALYLRKKKVEKIIEY
jgi:DNA polymerase-3 subunit epsilon